MRLAPEHHVLALALHHIAFDGWSAGLLLHELEVLYRGGRLPALPLDYADYALWQRARRFEGELAYWGERLKGAPAVLTLPLDHPRGSHHPAGRVAVRLAEVRGLERLGRAHGASLFMVLQAAFAAVLGRWAGQDEVVVGTPVAGRLHEALEG